jgi:hypothetical protein
LRIVELIQILERALNPESVGDVLITSVAFIICIAVFSISTGLIERRWSSVYRLVEILVALAILYGVTQISIRPYWQRFSGNTVGILFYRFSGANLTEHLGIEQLNEVLEAELRLRLQEFEGKMKLPRLDTLISVSSVSWAPKSDEQARRIAGKYNATAFLWGNVRKLHTNYKLVATFDAGNMGFGFKIPGIDPCSVLFNLTVGGDYTIRFSDTSYDHIASIAKELINGIIPSLAIKVSQNDPALSAELIRRLPSIDKWYKQFDFAPFLILSAADAFEKVDSTKKALEYYALSWEYFTRLIEKVQSGSGGNLPPVSTMNRFAAVAKMQEGTLSIREGDTLRSRNCFMLAFTAAKEDSSLQQVVLRNGIATGALTSDTVVIEIEAP